MGEKAREELWENGSGVAMIVFLGRFMEVEGFALGWDG